MKIDWLDKLQYFLQTMAFCLAISAIQYAFQPQRAYEVPLVYSLCIGSFTWGLIDFGRHAFPSAARAQACPAASRSRWPMGRRGGQNRSGPK